jgi:hypothetical protein
MTFRLVAMNEDRPPVYSASRDDSRGPDAFDSVKRHMCDHLSRCGHTCPPVLLKFRIEDGEKSAEESLKSLDSPASPMRDQGTAVRLSHLRDSIRNLKDLEPFIYACDLLDELHICLHAFKDLRPTLKIFGNAKGAADPSSKLSPHAPSQIGPQFILCASKKVIDMRRLAEAFDAQENSNDLETPPEAGAESGTSESRGSMDFEQDIGAIPSAAGVAATSAAATSDAGAQATTPSSNSESMRSPFRCYAGPKSDALHIQMLKAYQVWVIPETRASTGMTVKVVVPSGTGPLPWVTHCPEVAGLLSSPHQDSSEALNAPGPPDGSLRITQLDSLYEAALLLTGQPRPPDFFCIQDTSEKYIPIVEAWNLPHPDSLQRDTVPEGLFEQDAPVVNALRYPGLYPLLEFCRSPFRPAPVPFPHTQNHAASSAYSRTTCGMQRGSRKRLSIQASPRPGTPYEENTDDGVSPDVMEDMQWEERQERNRRKHEQMDEDEEKSAFLKWQGKRRRRGDDESP